MNSKLHALADALGRSITFFLTAGQTSDFIGRGCCWAACRRRRRCSPTAAIEPVSATGSSEPARTDWFRKALSEREILPCIPGRRARKVPIEYDPQLYRERRRIENMFGRLKDWRRIATHYDRCADLFLSAFCLAAVVPYWL